MSQFWDSIKDVKRNYKRYDAWEQNQADDVAKRKYLSAKLDLPKDKVEITRSKAQAVFRASDMMDKRSEDNCANMEQTTGLVAMAALLPVTFAIVSYQLQSAKKSKAVSNKQSLLVAGISIAVPIIAGIGFSLWGTAKQKEASRIGRFQAKQHELKDAKNFVIYTPEQIEAAKIRAKNIPDKKNKKSIFKLFTEMKEMSRDKVNYNKWIEQKNGNKEEIQKILNTTFTPKQIAQGEEDKEIIVNIVKDVNMSAETYSENVENAFDTIGSMTLITDIPIYFAVNKILKNFKNISSEIKQFAPILACALFTLPMLFWETHEKKEGSRVGRFLKRQEILDNPELIMAYSDEQLKQVKDIKEPKFKKGFFEDLKNNLKFFGKYLKEKKEYNKYKETTAKESEKLYEALKQTSVSEVQLKEAKNLQEKTFRTFDKIDEMSQRYSEDTEAATQIAKQIISPVFSLAASLGIPAVAILAVKKSKFHLRGIIKTASNIVFKKGSSLKAFITKASEIIKKDANLKKDFSKIAIDKTVQERVLAHPELNKLYMELDSQNKKYLTRLTNIKDINEIENISKEIFNEHGRKDPVSKWIRNLAGDIFKLLKNKKLEIKNVEQPVTESKPFVIMKKFYNDYKTLCNTAIIGGSVPFFGVAIGIPLAISSWMTNVQIKAGRIGIMKAMDEIDNPKLFVNDDTTTKV